MWTNNLILPQSYIPSRLSRVKNCLEICVTCPEMIELHVYESYRFSTYYGCLHVFSKFSSINIINTMQCAAAFYVYVQTNILHFLYDRNNIRMLSKQCIDFLLLIYKENTFLIVSIGNFPTLFIFFMFKKSYIDLSNVICCFNFKS